MTKRTTKPAAAAPTKLPPRYAAVAELIERPTGASAAEVGESLTLERHSVRGMLSTATHRYGWEIEKSREGDRGTVYRLTGTNGPTKPRKPARAKKAPAADRKAKATPKRATTKATPKTKAAKQPAAPKPRGLGDLIKAKLASKTKDPAQA